MPPNRVGSYGHILANWVPVPADSLYLAVTTSEQDFASQMAANEFYLLTTTCDCYIKQGVAAVNASAAAGSMLVPRGLPVLIDSAKGTYLSVIGIASGAATLQRVVAAA